MYTTLPGSIITTVCILNKKTVNQAKRSFARFKKMLNELPESTELNIDNLFDMAWNMIGSETYEPERSRVILLYDNANIRTPLVSFVDDEGNLMPLDPEGYYYGIMLDAVNGSDNVAYEYMFNEVGQREDVEYQILED